MEIANVEVKMVVHCTMGSVPPVRRNCGNEFDMSRRMVPRFYQGLLGSPKAFKVLDDFASADALSLVREKTNEKVR
jgi:hypothetical protein